MHVTAEVDYEFRNFVLANFETLRKQAFWMCGDWHTSEDIVQDALVAMHRYWPGIDNAGRTSYARAVISHLVLRERDRRGRRKEDPLNETDAGAYEEEWVDRVTLRDAVAHLPPRQRVVVMLRFWNALSTGEIAERLSLPAGTVRSDLTRAYAILRTLLEEAPCHRKGEGPDTQIIISASLNRLTSKTAATADH